MNLLSLTRTRSKIVGILVTRALAASFALGGCAPATSLEQANSTADVEREGHRRTAQLLTATEAQLARAQAENGRLSASREKLETSLSAEESKLAQTSLDMESAQKEKEQQTELVTQLRGELARVGEHLKAYEGDKAAVAASLAVAQQDVLRLEAEVAHLRAKAQTSEEEAEKLRGALTDLAQMKESTDAQETAPGPAPDAPPPTAPGEVLPKDEPSEP